eukprot:TRINITY_DN32896_c0_g1_i2.p1 TRINITY_DN32896_c0_g1~~TRINITY_DN32896_c0_g1_i2.p1  ORF type:complete len:669 (-),score=149.60 TRINITY_DN32896_c0_g1_i2:98-2104(-)
MSAAAGRRTRRTLSAHDKSRDDGGGAGGTSNGSASKLVGLPIPGAAAEILADANNAASSVSPLARPPPLPLGRDRPPTPLSGNPAPSFAGGVCCYRSSSVGTLPSAMPPSYARGTLLPPTNSPSSSPNIPARSSPSTDVQQSPLRQSPMVTPRRHSRPSSQERGMQILMSDMRSALAATLPANAGDGCRARLAPQSGAASASSLEGPLDEGPAHSPDNRAPASERAASRGGGSQISRSVTMPLSRAPSEGPDADDVANENVRLRREVEHLKNRLLSSISGQPAHAAPKMSAGGGFRGSMLRSQKLSPEKPRPDFSEEVGALRQSVRNKTLRITDLEAELAQARADVEVHQSRLLNLQHAFERSAKAEQSDADRQSQYQRLQLLLAELNQERSTVSAVRAEVVSERARGKAEVSEMQSSLASERAACLASKEVVARLEAELQRRGRSLETLEAERDGWRQAGGELAATATATAKARFSRMAQQAVLSLLGRTSSPHLYFNLWWRYAAMQRALRLHESEAAAQKRLREEEAQASGMRQRISAEEERAELSCAEGRRAREVLGRLEDETAALRAELASAEGRAEASKAEEMKTARCLSDVRIEYESEKALAHDESALVARLRLEYRDAAAATRVLRGEAARAAVSAASSRTQSRKWTPSCLLCRVVPCQLF